MVTRQLPAKYTGTLVRGMSQPRHLGVDMRARHLCHGQGCQEALTSVFISIPHTLILTQAQIKSQGMKVISASSLGHYVRHSPVLEP